MDVKPPYPYRRDLIAFLVSFRERFEAKVDAQTLVKPLMAKSYHLPILSRAVEEDDLPSKESTASWHAKVTNSFPITMDRSPP